MLAGSMRSGAKQTATSSPTMQTPRSERRDEQVLRAPDVGRRREHERLTWPRVRSRPTHTLRFSGLQIGGLALRRSASGRRRERSPRRPSPTTSLVTRKRSLVHAREREASEVGVEKVRAYRPRTSATLACEMINPDDLQAGTVQCKRRRQSDVAESDHRNRRREMLRRIFVATIRIECDCVTDTH